MWEQIRSNRRKSVLLVAAMAALLLGLGYVIAEAFAPGAGLVGLGVAMVVWLVMSLVAYFQGGQILLSVSGAKRIEKEDHPELFNVVEEMTIASGLPKMPDVYIINDTSPNAFATGRDTDHAAVAVTAGLLESLDRDELQGVIGHEMAHVVNRDVLLMSMVGVMLGAIVMTSQVFLRGLIFGGGRSRRYSGRSGKGGGGAAVMMIVAIVLAILAPILAQVIYFAVSRRREYLADAHGAVLTRYPEGLASALERIAGGPPVRRANKATAAMYIVPPLKKANLAALTRTHPPTAERVKILRSMGGMVTYGAYQEAWQKSAGAAVGLPASAVRSAAGGAAREPSVKPQRKDPREQLRETGDLLRKVNNFIFLTCVCGLKFKLPPNLGKDHVTCPRCKRGVAVPVAGLAAAQELGEHLAGYPADGLAPDERVRTARAKTDQPANETVRIQAPRPENGWSSFKCVCGAAKTLSPGMQASRLQCGRCGRTIELV